jgi:phosphoserine phosphatase
MKKVYQLLAFSGEDKPGHLASLLGVLARHQVKLIDIGQTVTHHFLSVSLLLEELGDEVLTELDQKANELNLRLHTRQLVDRLPEKHSLHKYILSCVSPRNISPAFIQDSLTLLGEFKLQIRRMESIAETGFTSLDIYAAADSALPHEKIKMRLMDLSHQHQVDMAFLLDDAFRLNKKLIVFDMDSTLIQAEVIDEMAHEHGIGEKVKAITERAMNGELNFDQALRERVALLKGFERSKMEGILKRLPLTPGTEKFIKTVKKLGYKTAIVSGGFRYFAENLQEQLGMDYAFANELEFNGDVLTGLVKGDIINAQKKAQILTELAQKENIHLEQVVAIGDGANDLLMLAQAGLGIAFHAKEKVRREARHQLGHGPMTSILYFLGIPGDHFDETV